MKVIPFNVPKTDHAFFRLQIDRQAYLYDKLHHHPETQIMYILKSEGTLVAGDYVGRFGEGDVFLIGSHQPHVFRNDDHYYKQKSKRPAHAISIYFEENYAGQSFWQLTELDPIRKFLLKAACGFRIKGQTKANVIELLLLLTRQSGIERLITFFQILRILSESKELTRLAMTPNSTAFNAGEGKRMNDILQFTFHESHRKIYVAEVAAVANLSVEAFCRYFKLRTRKTFTNFLNEVRISKACQLIIASDKLVQEICFDAGFNNLSHFNRVFKKVTGKTPRTYLSSVRLQ